MPVRTHERQGAGVRYKTPGSRRRKHHHLHIGPDNDDAIRGTQRARGHVECARLLLNARADAKHARAWRMHVHVSARRPGIRIRIRIRIRGPG